MRGNQWLARQDYQRALIEFRNAANAMPKDAEPVYRMGLAYLGRGDTRAAYQSFLKALGLNPAHSGAQLKVSEMRIASRDQQVISNAVSQLIGTFGQSPDDPEVIDTLAIGEWKLGKTDEALERLDEAVKRFPASLQSSVTLAQMKLRQNDAAGAEEVMKKAVSEAPRSANATLALARIYTLLRQPEKAESALQRTLQLDPENIPALFALGSLQLAARRTEDADRTYRRLAALPGKGFESVHAIFLYRTNQREAALSELQKLARADGNNREVRMRLVQAYFGLNRVAEAEKELAASLQRDPKDTGALLQRAQLRLRMGRADDAERDLQEVLHYTPDSVLAQFALASVYQAKGLPHSQQQELEKIVDKNPGLLAARLELAKHFLYGKQAQTAQTVLETAPNEQKRLVPWLVLHNWCLMAGAHWQETRAGIEQALRLGKTPDTLYQKAAFLFLQRDYPGARSQIEELLNSNPADVRSADLMMQISAAQKQIPQGLAKLQDLAVRSPKSAPFQKLLGEWYGRSGNSAAARSAYERATAADPHFVPASLALAELDLQEGRRDPAIQRLDAVLATAPSDVSALLLSARAEDEAGDRAKSIVRYRKVLEVDSSNPMALNNLAYALAWDNPDEALQFAQKAAEIVPDNPYALDTLGWVYYRKGIYSMAVRYLEAAVQKGSTPKREFHLGMGYLKAGDRLRGQQMMRQALQQNPSLVKTEQGW